MKDIIDYVTNNIILLKLSVSAILIIINLVVINVTNRVLFKTIRNNGTYFTTKKRFYYLYSFVLFILLVLLWSGSEGGLTKYVGFISAGIAIALREIFTNIAAWMIIVFQKTFEVGDRITVNGQTGDVIDIKMYQFVLMEVSDIKKGEQSTGRIVHIPNNYMFLHQITNSSKGFDYIWNEMDIRLDINCNWNKAKELLEAIIDDHSLHLMEEAKSSVHEASKKYMLHYNNLTPIVYTSVSEGDVVLTLRYLCEPRKARMSENQLWQQILTEFSLHNDINLK